MTRNGWADFLVSSSEQERRLRRLQELAVQTAVDDWVTGHQGRTIRDTICHLAVYYPPHEVPGQIEKLRRLAAAGSTRRMPGFDLDRVNQERIRAYDGTPLNEVFDVIFTGRREIRRLLLELDPGLQQVTVRGTRWGDVPVQRIIEESTFGHDRLHADEMEQTLLEARVLEGGARL